MSKNQKAIAFAVANAVLALFAQQVASGQYPIGEPTKSVIMGILALVIAGLTALSPFFDWRQVGK